jgi:DNA invertase Pin-like site-specific DNA recombinase
MPGDGGLNATVIKCSSDTPACRPRDKISQHNVTASQRSVLTINTCMLTTAYRGTTRARPGLREALAACRAGDVLVVTKLDRLARSLRDATDIADELTNKGVALNLGGAVYDPTDPVGRLLFNVLGMVAEFEADLIRARTREGMAIAKAAGKLRGRKPKLTPSQEKHLAQLHRTGAHTTSEIAELFGVARSTVYRAIQRGG